eukprot:scaffold4141_cov335-Prasinococcus_capsulatus_cf.AAC.1
MRQGCRSEASPRRVKRGGCVVLEQYSLHASSDTLDHCTCTTDREADAAGGVTSGPHIGGVHTS